MTERIPHLYKALHRRNVDETTESDGQTVVYDRHRLQHGKGTLAGMAAIAFIILGGAYLAENKGSDAAPTIQTSQSQSAAELAAAYASVAPPNCAQYEQYIIPAAINHGIPPYIFAALAEHESAGCDPRYASNGQVHPGGNDYGLTGINAYYHPAEARKAATDPAFAADWSAGYLAEKIKQAGSIDGGLERYNGSNAYSLLIEAKAVKYKNVTKIAALPKTSGSILLSMNKSIQAKTEVGGRTVPVV